MIRVGLESHIAISDDRKLFCNCRPGKQSCCICRGYPGFRPLSPSNLLLERIRRFLNYLKADTNPIVFYRKVYSYHDLWSGYQRTQNPFNPVGVNGVLKNLGGDPYKIKSIYLQEDPASTEGQNISHDRAGSPLLELVTETMVFPDKEKALRGIKTYLWTLKRLAQDLGLLEKKGVIKTDLNVSSSIKEFRIEVKNLSSIKDITTSIKTFDLHPVKEDSTFGVIRGVLTYQRPKKVYPFVIDSDLKPIILPKVEEEVHTYPQLYETIKNLKGGTETLALELTNLLWEGQLWKAVDKPAGDFSEYRSKIYAYLVPENVKKIISHKISTIEYKEFSTINIEVKKELHSRGLYLKSSLVESYIRDCLKRAPGVRPGCNIGLLT